MARFPQEWEDELKAEGGVFSPYEFSDWLRDEATDEQRNAIETGLDNDLSLEWSILAANHDASTDPHDWNSVTISFDKDDGNWDVSIVDNEGQSFTIPDVEDADVIWADLWYALKDADWVDVEVEYPE